jgi:acyl transferase domain-containing protein
VSAPKIGFFFADQGSQYIGMGKKLYETQPLFKESLDECAEILDAHLDKPILHLIFGKAEDLSLINTGTYAQPILFALEYALANMWRAWGIEPFLLMGCGVGEYVAACIAGVFDLRDGLMLIAARGRLERYLPLNEEFAASFDKVAEKVTYSTPAIRLIPPHHLFTSTTNKAMNHPEYWCRQVRKPKGERSGLETVFTGECELFLEIGPGSDLIKITKEYFPQYTETCFPSLDGERDDWQRVLESLSELYVRGTEIDWMALNQGARVRRISLPTYPFERERCWFDPEKPRDSMR